MLRARIVRRALLRPVRRRPFAIAAIALAVGSFAPARARGQLAPPTAPPENPVTAEKSVLGKILFWDEQLSSDNTVACGTCHRPSAGGGDVRFVPLAGPDGRLGTRDDLFGSPGISKSDAGNAYEPDPTHGFKPQITARNSPDFIMGGYFTELFWDGRATSAFVDPQSGNTSIAAGGALESQCVGPPASDVEMAHAGRDWNEITAKLQASHPLALATDLPADVVAALAVDPTYPDLFETAFGDPAINSERIAFALATYERGLVPDQTPWDAFNQGDSTALTARQQRGLNLFNSKANCFKCHVPGTFTDDLFHTIGLRDPATDPLRENVTGDHGDRGKAKTPSLRNVGLRRRLMHSGEFPDIPGVVGFYDGGGVFTDNLDPLIVRLRLSPRERDDLTDFLQHGLDDPRVRDETAPFDRPTLYSEQLTGNPSIYGAASAGSGGFLPQMLAQTPPNVANVDFKFGVTDGLGNSPALLLLADAAAAPGAHVRSIPINVDFAHLVAVIGYGLDGAGAGAGYQTFATEIPDDPALAGYELFAQWFVLDGGAADRIAASAGVHFTLF